MNKEKGNFFLHSNEVNHISKEDYAKVEVLVNAVKAFARSTYQCVYIIDYFHQDFVYASNNLAYLLTSSSCHPKIFVKEFSYFLMSCHQHCLGVNLLVQR